LSIHSDVTLSRRHITIAPYLSRLLLGEPLAPAHLADLVALVVAAGRALAAVVLPLAADALAASLPLLLVRLLRVEAHARRRLLGPEAVSGLAVRVPVAEAVAGGRRREEQPGNDDTVKLLAPVAVKCSRNLKAAGFGPSL